MGNLIWSIIIGIAAGFIAGKIMKGSGFGLLLNLVVGLVGGLLGGWIFTLLGIGVNGTVGTLVMSTVGAVALLWIISLFKKKE
ncbi:putative membrane protein YeaQ/YmgE (transglycosylase-associated protein family) [Dysgonomonas sp. PFB1-18]|uniref:GlsB/YeaQ/YmgE family stress response membrane protein n=1 Tax=unclassified Dysgonomonas TaxID=2630389 RepID=UPI002475C187|nr:MULTISPECIES: GlsB/YeaQ/YmgE family stress response membrane protein [unclassified Dysgonomonas]MDH6310779.1 putative membrane protein YeaQ/YmgE (transglycosylase-associated protein family) [Dysgonomonas sp. PF1-14]MDH6340629.1 putative membrane protein YeaQ/YmgE (transglycosylase-associated protein family) [Dysgonomonas sp. PF1-16]MDH6382264.1 putative membrane protein YeaQ/YmgE (transglycosylase-associated protein family) [Dysgonomonas sp. PFB1-18]MDH6399599.1 putative membrane protein Yea